MKTLTVVSLLLVALGASASADGLGDNDPQNVRQVPRLGIDVPDDDRQVLQSGLDRLQHTIQLLMQQKDPQTHRLLPDVEIFHRAVRDALKHREFFAKSDVTRAKELLEVGQQRADALLAGQAPWTTQTGLVVRGYRSRIDRTAQPYGLVIRPNPLNPKRYVVVNSGFTYREYAYLNNARQVPMLPDWAVVDLRTPPGSQFPGKTVAADFFDEDWQLKP